MKRVWWKEAVVYQIYPRSFKDSNGDGIGDLRGIIEKLDYIASLGIDVVWLNPIYSSPNYDNGYDISDYENIMEEFGTLEDFDELIRGLHARKIRLVMDLVVNHSSSFHPWFIEAKKSKTSARRNFYIWRQGVAGGPPNDWKACFTGSAWQLDKESGEYYLHLFAPEQPDLNWENPELRSEVFAMMNLWLDRGVDGFRMDTINLISKDPSYRNLKPEESMFSTTAPYVYGPKLHDYIREMRQKTMAQRDVMTVGEAPGSTVEKALDLVGENRGELDMLFQFELVEADWVGDKWHHQKLDLRRFKKIIEHWQQGLYGRAWNSNFLMNHDQPRSVSRFGDDRQYRSESAKALLLLNLSLGGTPYLYEGEELGMTNSVWNSIGDFRDLDSINYYHEALGLGEKEEAILDSLRFMSRDNARTPMQWDASANAGFSTGKPWIDVNPNYREINVKAQEAEPESVLAFAKAMLRFRKTHQALVYGQFSLVRADDPKLFAFTMDDGEEKLLVAVNMSSETVPVPTAEELPLSLQAFTLKLLLSNYPKHESRASENLSAWEARICSLSQK